MALEPRVSISTVDQTIGYNADPVDNRLNILCSAVTPAGPTELTRVSGPSEFQRLFFGGRSVKISDDMSAVYTRALLANAPIWVKRATRNNLKGGLSSALGDEIFVDPSLNLISGLKLSLSLDDSKITSYVSALEALDTSETVKIVRNETSVYSPAPITGNLPKTESAATTLKRGLKITSELTEDVTVTIGSTQYKLSKGSTEFSQSFLQNIYEDGILPQAFEKDSNPVTVIIEDGSVPSTVSANEISWISKLSISLSTESAGLEVTDLQEAYYVTTIKESSEYYETYKLTDFKFDLVMSDSTVKYSFYTESTTPTVGATMVKLDGETFEEVFKSLVSKCTELLGADTGNGYSLVIPEGDSNNASTKVESTEVIGSVSAINTASENDRFAVIAAFSCSSNDFTVSISEGDIEDTYVINVNYASLSESWTIAFDTGIYDGYGESLYYQKVNDESQLIRIIELQGDSILPQTFTLGDEITSKYCGVTEMVSAMENMKETDESTVYFDFITDSGIVNSTLSNYIFTLCDFYHSFYAPSCYVDKPLTVSTIKALRDSLGNHATGRLIAQTQRASVLDSGSVIMPASYFYLVERINLGNTSLEFRNIFGPNYGDISMQSPLQKFTTAEREALLDLQVTTLKRGITGTWFLNSDLTLYKTDSFLQEDGIVLMVNKINQLADRYSQDIIGLGLGDPESVMASLRSSLSIKIHDRLRVGTSEGPNSVRVVCDSSNNPSSLLNQGKVRVDIYATFGRSVKEVLVYSYVMPLS